MHGLRALLLAVLPMSSLAGEATILHLDHGDSGGLQRALLDVAQQRLESTGLVLDRDHAWLGLSAALPPADEIEARPTWSSVAGVPALPLTFELRTAKPGARVVKATLAIRLRRPVLVATRRLRKGSHVSCADLAAQLRDVSQVRRASLLSSCEERADAAALRDIAAGEVLRAADIGSAPDVQLGAPVQVSASSGGIVVTAMATALADARVGDQIDVRLQRPMRTLRTRVTARGAVQLVDETP